MVQDNLSPKKVLFYEIILIFLILLSSQALMASSKHTEFSFLYGVGSSSSISKIIAKKKIISPISYLAGIEYRSPAADCFPIKFDIQVLKHFVRQKSFEIVACPTIISSDVYFKKVGFNWAVGNGISVLIGKNGDFEQTQNVKPKRVLNYLLIEQNIFLKEKPYCQLVLRWHHRCHVFGTIAPKTTGSNFFVIGVKYLI